jgi:hypothetical protein
LATSYTDAENLEKQELMLFVLPMDLMKAIQTRKQQKKKRLIKPFT